VNSHVIAELASKACRFAVRRGPGIPKVELSEISSHHVDLYQIASAMARLKIVTMSGVPGANLREERYDLAKRLLFFKPRRKDGFARAVAEVLEPRAAGSLRKPKPCRRLDRH
jgi:hypothetical protein